MTANNKINLPIIKAFNRTFYFDERLKQLRKCDNPHVNINLTQTDTDSVAYLITNKIKVNWNNVLVDYKYSINGYIEQ